MHVSKLEGIGSGIDSNAETFFLTLKYHHTTFDMPTIRLCSRELIRMAILIKNHVLVKSKKSQLVILRKTGLKLNNQDVFKKSVHRKIYELRILLEALIRLKIALFLVVDCSRQEKIK
ncbi:hypothetical protein GJ496_012041 [Pomphorhynchus laevis]|nr:hypothetical protein GJ496_012041 [Pomphorhynchus laevis]